MALPILPDPTRTLALFRHARVGSGYASARPYLHPEAIARARELIGLEAPVGRALDVGCGTGLSSRALLDIAREVVGVDASVPMLRHAGAARGLRYVASTAELLPFVGRPFDVVAACGSIDWVDRERFLPRAAELLAARGWLVALDFGHAGRSSGIPDLESWYRESFRRSYPPPPSADPFLTLEEAARHGFSPPRDADLVLTWPCTAAQYVEFLLTESSVIAAVEYGDEAVDGVRQRLRDDLAPFFGEGVRDVEFGGYVQALRKL